MFKQNWKIWLAYPIVPSRMGGGWAGLVKSLRDDLTPAERAYEGGDTKAQIYVVVRRTQLLTVGLSIQRRNTDFRLTGLDRETKATVRPGVECFDRLYEVAKELCARESRPLPAPKTGVMEIMYSLLLEACLCPPYLGRVDDPQYLPRQNEYIAEVMQPTRQALYTLDQSRLRNIIPIEMPYSYYVSAWAIHIAEKDNKFRSEIFNPYLASLSAYTQCVKKTGGLFSDSGSGAARSIQGRKKSLI